MADCQSVDDIGDPSALHGVKMLTLPRKRPKHSMTACANTEHHQGVSRLDTVSFRGHVLFLHNTGG